MGVNRACYLDTESQAIYERGSLWGRKHRISCLMLIHCVTSYHLILYILKNATTKNL